MTHIKHALTDSLTNSKIRIRRMGNLKTKFKLLRLLRVLTQAHRTEREHILMTMSFETEMTKFREFAIREMSHLKLLQIYWNWNKNKCIQI